MNQWLGIDPLTAFALRRLEVRGWRISVHFVNGTIELHAVDESSELPVVHIARCNDGQNPEHQRRATRLLAEACGLPDSVLGDT